MRRHGLRRDRFVHEPWAARLAAFPRLTTPDLAACAFGGFAQPENARKITRLLRTAFPEKPLCACANGAKRQLAASMAFVALVRFSLRFSTSASGPFYPTDTP